MIKLILLLVAATAYALPTTTQSTTDTTTVTTTVTVKRLQVLTIINAPFVDKDSTGRFFGLIPDMLDAILGKIGGSYQMTAQEDRDYGLLVNGTWTGMIGALLINDQFDMIAADLTHTKDREDAVDHSVPWWCTKLRILRNKNWSENLPTQFVVVGGSANAAILENAQEGRLSEIQANITFVNSTAEGIQQVVNNPQVALIEDEVQVIFFIEQYKQDVEWSDEVLKVNFFDFAFPIGSDWRKIFSDGILDLSESGEMEKLVTKNKIKRDLMLNADKSADDRMKNKNEDEDLSGGSDDNEVPKRKHGQTLPDEDELSGRSDEYQDKNDRRDHQERHHSHRDEDDYQHDDNMQRKDRHRHDEDDHDDHEEDRGDRHRHEDDHGDREEDRGDRHRDRNADDDYKHAGGRASSRGLDYDEEKDGHMEGRGHRNHDENMHGERDNHHEDEDRSHNTEGEHIYHAERDDSRDDRRDNSRDDSRDDSRKGGRREDQY